MKRQAKLLEFVNRVKRPRDVPEDTIELVEADTESEAECRSMDHYTDEASSTSHYPPSLTSEPTDFRLSLTPSSTELEAESDEISSFVTHCHRYEIGSSLVISHSQISTSTSEADDYNSAQSCQLARSQAQPHDIASSIDDKPVQPHIRNFHEDK